MIVPTDSVSLSTLAKRYYCDYNGYCYNSNWYTWQRWVVLGVVIVAAFLAFLLCACTTARRRRTRGLAPYYGTGWAAHGPPPAYDVNNPVQQGNTGPQYGGYTSPPSVPPHPNQNYNQYDQNNANQGSAGGYYGQPNNNNYEMGGYGAPSGGYAPPRSPPPSHVKY